MSGTYKHFSPKLRRMAKCVAPDRCAFGAVFFPDDATPEEVKKLEEEAIMKATNSTLVGTVGKGQNWGYEPSDLTDKERESRLRELEGEVDERTTFSDDGFPKSYSVYATGLADKDNFAEYMYIKTGGDSSWSSRDTNAFPEEYRPYMASFEKDHVLSQEDDDPSDEEIVASIHAHKMMAEKNADKIADRVTKKYSNPRMSNSEFMNSTYVRYAEKGLGGKKYTTSNTDKNLVEDDQLDALRADFAGNREVEEAVALNEPAKDPISYLNKSLILDRAQMVNHELKLKAQQEGISDYRDVNPDSVSGLSESEGEYVYYLKATVEERGHHMTSYDPYIPTSDVPRGVRKGAFSYQMRNFDSKLDEEVDMTAGYLLDSDHPDNRVDDLKLAREIKDMSREEASEYLAKNHARTVRPVAYAAAMRRDSSFGTGLNDRGEFPNEVEEREEEQRQAQRQTPRQESAPSPSTEGSTERSTETRPSSGGNRSDGIRGSFRRLFGGN